MEDVKKVTAQLVSFKIDGKTFAKPSKGYSQTCEIELDNYEAIRSISELPDNDEIFPKGAPNSIILYQDLLYKKKS